MQPRIVQTGTYCSANKGDAAMQLACATAIKERWPQAEIDISSPFPSLDAPFYGSIAQVIPCHRRRLIYSTLQLIRSATWRLIRSLTGKDARWLIPDTELQAYRRADLVIDLSGDMLTEDYGVHVAISHYIPLLNTILLDCPLFICAQSIGPFRWTRPLARWIFRRASAITLREEISFNHLSSIGVDRTSATLTSDMAFLLPSAPQTRIDDILDRENISVDETPIVGISVSRILEQNYKSIQRAEHAPFIQLVADALDDFAQLHHVKLLFIAHVTGPTKSKDDRIISREIANKMSSPVHILNGDYRSDELKGIIARCALFIGARMHANIAALSSGVPVLALSYSHKSNGIMRLLGQEQWTISGCKLTTSDLTALITELWSKRTFIGDALLETKHDLEARAKKNLQLVGRLIGSKDGVNELP